MRTGAHRTKRPRRKVSSDYGPTDIGRAIGRATRLLLAGDGLRSLPGLRRALGEYPDCGRLHARHGDALYLAERLAEARDAYQRALFLEDTIFQAWYGLGCAEFSGEAYAAAIECFRCAVALEAGDADARMYLGRSFFHMGCVDEAIDEFLAVAKTADRDLRRKALGQIATIIPGSPTSGNEEVMKSRVAWARLEQQFERRNGDRWASRTSRTLVLAAGLEEWDVPSREDYVERAIALAISQETSFMLAVLRSGMRARLLDSAACDGRGLESTRITPSMSRPVSSGMR